MFRQEQSVQSAEYLVGARLRAIKSNFCHQHHWWDGRPLYEYSGVFYIDVEWSILHTLTQDVVYTAVHHGRLGQQKPIKGGHINMFNGAFADAEPRLETGRAS